jgi:putative ABC transport system ATP-binding protein
MIYFGLHCDIHYIISYSEFHKLTVDEMLETSVSPQPAPAVVLPAIIELRQLRKSYHTPAGMMPALRGVDLTVSPGEFITVMGKSGAGKSTLVNMITGIDQPDSGEILIAGSEVHHLSEDARARWRGLTLGVVFQFFQLLPSINLIKNVTIPMEFCGVFTPKERRERALHILDQVGLADHVYKRPSEISGGQQQRVAIARALANDPPILVADEPTGNLDSRTSNEIMDLFTSMVAQGKTLLIVTHDRSVAGRAARQVKIVDGLIEQD